MVVENDPRKLQGGYHTSSRGKDAHIEASPDHEKMVEPALIAKTAPNPVSLLAYEKVAKVEGRTPFQSATTSPLPSAKPTDKDSPEFQHAGDDGQQGKFRGRHHSFAKISPRKIKAEYLPTDERSRTPDTTPGHSLSPSLTHRSARSAEIPAPDAKSFGEKPGWTPRKSEFDQIESVVDRQSNHRGPVPRDHQHVSELPSLGSYRCSQRLSIGNAPPFGTDGIAGQIPPMTHQQNQSRSVNRVQATEQLWQSSSVHSSEPSDTNSLAYLKSERHDDAFQAGSGESIAAKVRPKLDRGSTEAPKLESIKSERSSSKADLPAKDPLRDGLRASQATARAEDCKVQNEPLQADVTAKPEFCHRSRDVVGSHTQVHTPPSARESGRDGGKLEISVRVERATGTGVRKVESFGFSKATNPACVPRYSATDRGSLTTRQVPKTESRVELEPCNGVNKANSTSPDVEILRSIESPHETKHENVCANKMDVLSGSNAVFPRKNDSKQHLEVQKLKPEPRFHPASTAIAETKCPDRLTSGSSRMNVSEDSITDKATKSAILTSGSCPTSAQIAHFEKSKPQLHSPSNTYVNADPCSTRRLAIESGKVSGLRKFEPCGIARSGHVVRKSTPERLAVAEIQRKGQHTKAERSPKLVDSDGDGTQIGGWLEYSETNTAFEKRAKAELYLHPAATDDDCENIVVSRPTQHDGGFAITKSPRAYTAEQVVNSLDRDGSNKPIVSTAISPSLQHHSVGDKSQQEMCKVNAESSLHPASTNTYERIDLGAVQRGHYSNVSSRRELLPFSQKRLSPSERMGKPAVLSERLATSRQPLSGPAAVGCVVNNEQNTAPPPSMTSLPTSGGQTVHDGQNIVSVDQDRPQSQVTVSPRLTKRAREIEHDVVSDARAKQRPSSGEQSFPVTDNCASGPPVDPRDNNPRATDFSNSARDEISRRIVTPRVASSGSQSPRDMETSEDAYAQFERAVETRNRRDRFDFPGQISYVGDPRNGDPSLDDPENVYGKDSCPVGNTDGLPVKSSRAAMPQGKNQSIMDDASVKHADRSRGANERYFKFYDARGRFKFGKDRTPVIFERRDGEDEKWASWSKKNLSSAPGQIAGGPQKDQKEDMRYSASQNDFKDDEKAWHRSSQDTLGSTRRCAPRFGNSVEPCMEPISGSGCHAHFAKPEESYFVDSRTSDFDEGTRRGHAVVPSVGATGNLEIAPSNIRQQSRPVNSAEDECQPGELSDGAVPDRTLYNKTDEHAIGPAENGENGHLEANHGHMNNQGEYLPTNANGLQELTEDELLKFPPQYRLSHQRVALLDDHVRRHTPNHEQLRMDLLHEDSQSFIDGAFDCSFATQLQKAVNFEVRAAKKRAGGRRRRRAKSMRQNN